VSAVWEVLAGRLDTVVVGRVVRVLDRVDSTNLEARRLVEAGDPAGGTAVLAREQTAGRGRMGRRWVSVRDAGVYLSVIFAEGDPVAGLDDPALLAMAGAIAVCRVLERYGVGSVRIKRPNDVLAEGRKVAGILVDTAGPAPPGQGGPGRAAVLCPGDRGERRAAAGRLAGGKLEHSSGVAAGAGSGGYLAGSGV